ncbi:MAG: cation transporter, partial [Firmicutes bacterium HGW-Firmicutes-13]
DVFSTVVVMIGFYMAKKPDDADHPYGHEKMEPVVAKILAGILFITALGIGYNGFQRIQTGNYEIPGVIALYAAVLSIIAKEWMYHYTVKGAKKIDSTALLADSWHHRSDAFSSIGALIGIQGARLGYKFFDPAASLIICVLISKVSIDIYRQSINQLVDHAGDKDTIENIRTVIMGVGGVIKINQLKTRSHASKLYVDVEVAVDSALSVVEGHEIAEEIHEKIENSDFKVKHCMVHIDPYKCVNENDQ